jgi:hypothetical protein
MGYRVYNQRGQKDVLKGIDLKIGKFPENTVWLITGKRDKLPLIPKRECQ